MADDDMAAAPPPRPGIGGRHSGEFDTSAWADPSARGDVADAAGRHESAEFDPFDGSAPVQRRPTRGYDTADAYRPDAYRADQRLVQAGEAQGGPEHGRRAAPGRGPRREVAHPDEFGSSHEFRGGLLLAILGYALAICAFAWAAFYRGGASPHHAITTALGILVTAASAVTMAVLIAAVIGLRRHPGRSAGLIVGMVIGLILGAVFFLPTADRLPGLDTRCPCAPMIQQLPGSIG